MVPGVAGCVWDSSGLWGQGVMAVLWGLVFGASVGMGLVTPLQVSLSLGFLGWLCSLTFLASVVLGTQHNF